MPIEKKNREWFIRIFSSVFICYHLLYVSDFLTMYTPILISPSQHVSLHLGGILFFSFLLVGAGRKSNPGHTPWYDILLAIAGLGVPLYYGFFYEDLILRSGEGALDISAGGWLLMALLLEASRRLLGLPFTSIVAGFVIYLLSSGYLPGILFHPSIPVLRIGEFMFVSGTGIFGAIVNISANVVIVFILFSQILLNAGAGDFFTSLATAAFGGMRGGPAKMAIISSGLFGTLSGSPVGNVAATGTFTIPLMKKTGYSSHYAGAVEAVASLGGILMPPVMGATIFILSDFLSMPYIEVCKRALMPAILYYLCLFMMVDQEAVRLKLKGLEKELRPPIISVLKKGWWYAIPLFVLIYLLAVVQYSPQKSAIWASASLVILSLLRKENRMGPMKLMVSFEQALRAMLQVGVAMGCASIIMAAFSITGLGFSISTLLTSISGGNLAVLLVLTALTSFVMGMGIGSIGCYIFLALAVVPAMVKMGVLGISAHLYVFYWSLLSFITPPVAILAYVAAGLAKANPFKVGWQASRLGVLAYALPFAFVLKPQLLLLGHPIDILVVTAFAVLGTVYMASGVGGHFILSLKWFQRLLFLAGAAILLFSTSFLWMSLAAIIPGVMAVRLFYLKKQAGPGSINPDHQNSE
ncbi:MAG: TRAP transporter fused permease subunit [Desulfobacterales bacterium]|nr:TRAP transporter fused permease subunit [Desulfobacterales bacterium]